MAHGYTTLHRSAKLFALTASLCCCSAACGQLGEAYFTLKRVADDDDGGLVDCEAYSYDDYSSSSVPMEHPTAAFDSRMAVDYSGGPRCATATVLGSASSNGDIDDEREVVHSIANVVISCCKFLNDNEGSGSEEPYAEGYSRSTSNWEIQPLESLPDTESGWIMGDLHISAGGVIGDPNQSCQQFSSSSLLDSRVGSSRIGGSYNQAVGWTVTWVLQNGTATPTQGSTIYPPYFSHTASFKENLGSMDDAIRVLTRCFNASQAGTDAYTGTDVTGSVTATVVATAAFYVDANVDQ